MYRKKSSYSHASAKKRFFTRTLRLSINPITFDDSLTISFAKRLIAAIFAIAAGSVWLAIQYNQAVTEFRQLHDASRFLFIRHFISSGRINNASDATLEALYQTRVLLTARLGFLHAHCPPDDLLVKTFEIRLACPDLIRERDSFESIIKGGKVISTIDTADWPDYICQFVAVRGDESISLNIQEIIAQPPAKLDREDKHYTRLPSPRIDSAIFRNKWIDRLSKPYLSEANVFYIAFHESCHLPDLLVVQDASELGDWLIGFPGMIPPYLDGVFEYCMSARQAPVKMSLERFIYDQVGVDASREFKKDQNVFFCEYQFIDNFVMQVAHERMGGQYQASNIREAVRDALRVPSNVATFQTSEGLNFNVRTAVTVAPILVTIALFMLLHKVKRIRFEGVVTESSIFFHYRGYEIVIFLIAWALFVVVQVFILWAVLVVNGASFPSWEIVTNLFNMWPRPRS